MDARAGGDADQRCWYVALRTLGPTAGLALSGLAGIALAGFADAHSTAASAANLAVTGALPMPAAALAVLLAFATNSVTKAVTAWVMGGRAFALLVIPGVVLMLVAAAGAALAAHV